MAKAFRTGKIGMARAALSRAYVAQVPDNDEKDRLTRRYVCVWD